MIQFHKMFLHQIENRKVHKLSSSTLSLANIFNQIISANREHFILIYLKYVCEYNDILDLFGTTLYGNKSLNKFLNEKRRENKPLTNYLILPVQRVPRYILLLSELKKHTAKTHSDYQIIGEALALVTEITEKINSEKKRIENISQCLQIQRTLIGLEHPIIDRQHHRLFEGQFVCLSSRKKR